MMIKNLQNKSEPVKRLIMWFGIIFIMAVIFIFWVSNFSSEIQTSKNSETALNSDALIGAPISWRRDLDKLPGVWQSFKDQLNGLNILWPK